MDLDPAATALALSIRLAHASATTRAHSAGLLGRMGAFAVPHLEALCKSLEDEVELVRSAAVRALVQLDADGVDVIQSLRAATYRGEAGFGRCQCALLPASTRRQKA